VKPVVFAAALAVLMTAMPVRAQDAASDAYERAVAARLAGQPGTAVALLEPIVAAEPANADAQVQFGLALLALDQLDAAEQAFRAALGTAPDYADARLGLARIAQRRGDAAAAARELDLIATPSPEADSLRAQLASGTVEPRWQLDLEGSYSVLDGPPPDWKEAAVQLRRQLEAGGAIGARVEYARRFGIDDVYGELTAEHILSSRARGYLSIGASVDPDFRPEWQIGMGGSLRVRDGRNATVLTLDARQARFAIGDVQSLTPGIEQYIGGSAWLTARWINLFDEQGTHRSGYLVRGDLQVLRPLRLFLGTSDAPDTDEGRVVDVRTVFGGASYDIGPHTILRVSLAHEDRATGFDRTQLGLGLGVGF
jgi:YaiO family outer membrane protein